MQEKSVIAIVAVAVLAIIGLVFTNATIDSPESEEVIDVNNTSQSSTAVAKIKETAIATQRPHHWDLQSPKHRSQSELSEYTVQEAAKPQPIIKKVTRQTQHHAISKQETQSEIQKQDAAADTSSVNLTQAMIEIALDDNADESNLLIETSIEFNRSPLPGIRYLPEPVIVGRFEYVYAHIVIPRACGSCVLKWRHHESDTIERIAPKGLMASQANTVFVTPDAGWKSGTYTLSIHDTEESNALLGFSTVLISDIHTNPLQAVVQTEYIQHLLQKGEAVKKLR